MGGSGAPAMEAVPMTAATQAPAATEAPAMMVPAAPAPTMAAQDAALTPTIEQMRIAAITETPIATEAAPVEEGKSEFTINLKEAGNQKVAVIKAVKEITGLGLGESKAIVDSVPSTVKEKATKDEAETAKKLLEEAGATVELV